ncbi:MAG: helix-turn-helix domain-containing protein, partial [Bacteroidales bacterium]|nr:helix-turn-helix domain-containing protein [Bacteroidales bacterium]
VLERLRTELSTQSDDEHLLPIIASWLSLLLEYCLRFYARQFKVQSGGEKGLLHRLENVLENYYTQQLQLELGLPTVRYCASQLCLSAGYFGDLVREATGDTAIAFIHRFVIHRANELLRAGSNVSNVAYDLGFQSPSHFSRLYKQVCGIPPSAYK